MHDVCEGGSCGSRTTCVMNVGAGHAIHRSVYHRVDCPHDEPRELDRAWLVILLLFGTSVGCMARCIIEQRLLLRGRSLLPATELPMEDGIACATGIPVVEAVVVEPTHPSQNSEPDNPASAPDVESAPDAEPTYESEVASEPLSGERASVTPAPQAHPHRDREPEVELLPSRR